LPDRFTVDDVVIEYASLRFGLNLMRRHLNDDLILFLPWFDAHTRDHHVISLIEIRQYGAVLNLPYGSLFPKLSGQ
jgi:hypothetical protein